MIVRALDENGDWLFGKGKNDYLKDNDAIAQSIQTRLKSFLGNCFFDIEAGIDWFTLLGSKRRIELNLAISTVITNTPNVLRITELSSVLDAKRNLTITYSVLTVFPGTIRRGVGILLTEEGDSLISEGGEGLHG